MATLTGDPDVQLAFAVRENPGVFALLLGSGLSRAAGIPTGWEITLDLTRRVAALRGVTDRTTNWEEWHRQVTGQAPNYSSLIEELGLLPDERRAILENYIEPTNRDREEGRKVPTKAHLAIAELVRDGFIRVIITTNFDRLMENALREKGVEPTIVSSEDSLSGAVPLQHARCYLLKLYGDYKDWRILNTDAELAAYPEKLNRLLDRVLDEYGLIVAGWSGEWDPSLRAAIARSPSRRYSLYWASHGDLRSNAKDLVSNRGAKVLSITDADSFFSKLSERVATLSESQTEDIQTVDLAVKSAKRFIRRAEYRVQLDELIADLGRRVIESAEKPRFGVHTAITQEEFVKRTDYYEGSSECLARVLGVLGRWGDNSEIDIATDSIRAVNDWAELVRGGNTVWLGLRSYPALLAFTAYGLGLTRARRWSVLHRLFSTRVVVDSQSKRLIEVLFLWR